jgi:hypothetical protein
MQIQQRDTTNKWAVKQYVFLPEKSNSESNDWRNITQDVTNSSFLWIGNLIEWQCLPISYLDQPCFTKRNMKENNNLWLRFLSGDDEDVLKSMKHW